MIELELNKHSYRQSAGIYWSAVSAVLLLTFILWGQGVSRGVLSVWAVTSLTLMCGGYGLVFYLYRRMRAENLEMTSWDRYFAYCSWLSGGCWGMAGALFFVPESLSIQLTLMLFMLSAVAATVPMLVANQVAFFGSAIFMVAPITYRLTLEDDSLHYGLAATAFAFCVAVAYFYINAHRSLKQSYELRFKNLQLVKQLKTQIQNNKTLMQQLIRKKETAERASSDKSDFLAATSHDLRQPLHAQSLLVSVLKKRISDYSTLAVLGKLEHTVDTLRVMFDELLDISKFDAGVIKPATRTFPVQQLFDDLQFEFSDRAIQKGIVFRTVESQATVHSDPVLVNRVLRNLVDNAIRHMKEGAILVCARPRKNTLSIEVRDNGSGIPEEQHKAIYKEFYQLNNPERNREKGLGLGLSIVRRICELLGHSITLRSAPEKGTTFAIELPSGGRSSPPTSPMAIDDTAFLDISISGNQILLVEDDIASAEAMRTLLSEWGCQVTVATTAKQVLSELDDKYLNSLDLVIADYRLPAGWTGIDVVAAIRGRIGQSVPALLMTGDSAVLQLQDVKKSGLTVLRKPTNTEKILAAINGTLFADPSQEFSD